MKPTEAKELELGTGVWVWIVRFGKGRWWPGTASESDWRPAVGQVRLQSFSLSQQRNTPPITAGFVSRPMRRLERRDINGRRLDRPKFVPTSRLRRPETLISANARVDAENVSS
jgi:hypothetical protein